MRVLGYPASPGTSLSESFRNLHSKRTARTSTATPDGLLRRNRSRPFSWLSLGRSKMQRIGTKSPSMPLPHHNSMSSVAKSSISSPMLTSTTNARVADVKNMECSDVLLPDYSSGTGASDRLPRHDRTTSRQSERCTNGHSAWAMTVKSVKKKLSHTRRASTSLLLDSPWVRRAGEKIGHSATPSTVSSHALGKFDASRGKVQPGQEAGRGSRLEPDSTEKLSDSISKPLNAVADPKTKAKVQQAPCLPGICSDSTTDLNGASLSRSFASALDKLDFQSSPTLVHDGTPKSRLKQAKSYFSLHKTSRENSLRNLASGKDRPNLSWHTLTEQQVIQLRTLAPGT